MLKFRNRIGQEGVKKIENILFSSLLSAGIIKNDGSLMDSSVLSNDILYPNDVGLLFQGIQAMKLFSEKNKLPWYEPYQEVKKLWKNFNMGKRKNRQEYLEKFMTIFRRALLYFKQNAFLIQAGWKQEYEIKLALYQLLSQQTTQKLTGKIHIENRIVSLKEAAARPIKKGKAFPSCEFGSTNQMTFNRQGFMVTSEIFIGSPGDSTLYLSTLKQVQEKIKAVPPCVVADLNYRSEDNFEKSKEIAVVFLGKTEDVPTEKQKFCQSARAATEGFIAVSKNLRGFAKSRYKGITGDKIWASLSQAAYNLKKFFLLYQQEEIEEKALIAIGLMPP